MKPAPPVTTTIGWDDTRTVYLLCASMRAIRIQRTGRPEVMEVVDEHVREPGPAEVRIRHRAIGVNFIDTYFRTGLYTAAKLPLILGSEGAGVVEAVGPNVTHLAARPCSCRRATLLATAVARAGRSQCRQLR
jgi:hypothetical protein